MRTFAYLLILAGACGESKPDAKGVVDESQPPGIPLDRSGGKADGGAQVVAIDVQSAHPYTNNLDTRTAISLAELPACAKDLRLHFRVLRTEAGYDTVSVEPAGQPAQTFDGSHDDTWTEWFRKAEVQVRLDTDGSITRHGFEIDQLEWAGMPDGCAAVRFPPCTADTVDLATRPGTCECPVAPICAPLATVEVRLRTSRRMNVIEHRIHDGGIATESHPGPTDALVTSDIGTVDMARVRELVRRAAEAGTLAAGGYDRPVGNARRDEFQIVAGALAVTFVAPEGGHAPAVQALIDELEAVFACSAGGGLACGGGYACSEEGECVVSEGCACPANFDPVCGENGHTYSNGCAAGCANAPVAHAGECGLAGDSCGTLFGLVCQGDRRCRYADSTFEAPHPDAGGTCVERTYCDAPADCSELAHPAVLGAWACESNTCAWQTGVRWKAFANGRFETTHPYANGTSVWKELYLPAEAQALRLVTESFRLESSYDFLEVWSFVNGAWVRDARYTGTTPPAATVEFAGRYHYLRFVSDSSITDHGFRVDAEWR
jgi:Kazal-type serine protease inhibitor domain